MKVIEDVLVMDSGKPLRSIPRVEKDLLAPAHQPSTGPRLHDEHQPLSVVRFPPEYVAPSSGPPFPPPLSVYEYDAVRVEWQSLDGRQPFYHRNRDVDEIFYQVSGERTLITELGVVEHREGDFSRVPRGVAHSNYGRRGSHLLFPLPAPVEELLPPVRWSGPVSLPYPGWEPGVINEAVIQRMGEPGHDMTVFPVGEQDLLDRVHDEDERIQVQRATASGWGYRADGIRIGMIFSYPGDERRYRRTLDADEIQYQAKGRRLVLSQRGVVEVGPGDFLRVPAGVARTDVALEPSEHVTVLSREELPQIAGTSRTAELWTPAQLDALGPRIPVDGDRP